MNTQTKRLIPKYTLEFKKDAARLGVGQGQNEVLQRHQRGRKQL